MRTIKTKTILGVPVAAVTMDEALDLVHDAIEDRRPLHIGVVNAAKMVNMARDPELRDAVLASNVIFADGMSVVWASRLLGERLPERVTGIDLMTGILERGKERGYRVYLLGAEAEVVGTVASIVRRDYPGVVITGFRDGYFKRDEEPLVAQEIAAGKPDVLFVAMTSPKKERFLAQWGPSLGVHVYHGVGGSFDVVAGKVKRAPRAWRALGLEWLYRLLQEPGRLWKRYVYTNSMFVWLVVCEWFGKLRTPAPRES
jgi:N-acetylglucosaminyldiphosphoundecaprenol N-acetyl-beta-D-mannosaminyltransferase